MFQILADDLGSYCSEAGVANIFYITKILFTILQVVVPIILIVSASFSLISMMSSPDNPKAKKSLINKVIAAIVVVLIPFIIEIVMGAIATGGGSKFNYADCWTNAYEAYSAQEGEEEDSDPGEKIREKCLINKKTNKPYDEENCCVSGGKWYKSIGKNGDPCDEKESTSSSTKSAQNEQATSNNSSNPSSSNTNSSSSSSKASTNSNESKKVVADEVVAVAKKALKSPSKNGTAYKSLYEKKTGKSAGSGGYCTEFANWVLYQALSNAGKKNLWKPANGASSLRKAYKKYIVSNCKYSNIKPGDILSFGGHTAVVIANNGSSGIQVIEGHSGVKKNGIKVIKSNSGIDKTVYSKALLTSDSVWKNWKIIRVK
ncbi:MAG: CHAP domain-containing protein [Bacilli bacterium]|nr:CHAP domain-containing protein [Bacilli bacterium]